MKIALYGMPCSGKTTLLSKLDNIHTINGSKELERITNNKFSSYSNDKKQNARIQYAKYIKSLNDKIVISDGHYSFFTDVVFTDSDANAYDVFIYLYCSPEILLCRYKKSKKNYSYSKINIKTIELWQDFEIEELRKICHNKYKDFYVIKNCEITPEYFKYFVNEILNGFSCYKHAKQIVSKIRYYYKNPCELHIVDGDKTIIKQDSLKLSTNYNSSIFDGDFYTGYQSLKFSHDIKKLKFDKNYIDKIELNYDILEKIKNKNYLVLSSGVEKLWNKISNKFKIFPIFANTMISADTKYFVTKILKNLGYNIISYGDSKIDFYMLKESNIGYLYIGDKISKSLNKINTHELELLYDKSPFILTNFIKNKFDNKINICKSNSGINGSVLAKTHIQLGEIIGYFINKKFPSKDTAILVLERGGRFFGDGIYTKFEGVFYSYNPSYENLPNIKQNIVLIVDSVINTGNSLKNIISKIKNINNNIEIIIATNVIQEKSIKMFNEYKIFAVRTSNNSFIGKNQIIQTNSNGPDTGDRLFNLIDNPFNTNV